MKLQVSIAQVSQKHMLLCSVDGSKIEEEAAVYLGSDLGCETRTKTTEHILVLKRPIFAGIRLYRVSK
jgi:hypothetical protein